MNCIKKGFYFLNKTLFYMEIDWCSTKNIKPLVVSE